jgi:hypothetical protein
MGGEFVPATELVSMTRMAGADAVSAALARGAAGAEVSAALRESPRLAVIRIPIPNIPRPSLDNLLTQVVASLSLLRMNC